ncbi:hypothetical protein ANN_23244 [Periplaneta americana]|uniref:Uncharacterized protein n=1 Tax=Periplaneta americana TaxID=6978 RepID=A0ABQ8SLT5_PERAM|nr:hypothetical protein ANN_23244 [Periplaneta americana]
MRPKICHRLPDIRVMFGENLGKSPTRTVYVQLLEYDVAVFSDLAEMCANRPTQVDLQQEYKRRFIIRRRIFAYCDIKLTVLNSLHFLVLFFFDNGIIEAYKKHVIFYFQKDGDKDFDGKSNLQCQ